MPEPVSRLHCQHTGLVKNARHGQGVSNTVVPGGAAARPESFWRKRWPCRGGRGRMIRAVRVMFRCRLW